MGCLHTDLDAADGDAALIRGQRELLPCVEEEPVEGLYAVPYLVPGEAVLRCPAGPQDVWGALEASLGLEEVPHVVVTDLGLLPQLETSKDSIGSCH